MADSMAHDKLDLRDIFENVQEGTPLVHCITNYVTVHDVANVLIACGGSPIMSDEPRDVEDIQAICGGLVCNIGTLNDRSIEAMRRAGSVARSAGHPVVLDPVGAGASALRTQTAAELLEAGGIACIRANVSEIKALASGATSTRGVDAAAGDAVTRDNVAEMGVYLRQVADATGAVVAASGAIDVVSDAHETYAILNGDPMMARITGSGCMLSAVVAAYLVSNPERPLEAAACAFAMYGLAGERAAERTRREGVGTATYSNYLIDAVSLMDAQTLLGGARIERIA